MSDTMTAAVAQYEELMTEWSKKDMADLDVCQKHLDSLKIALMDLSFLPTVDCTPTKQELVLARNVLELGAQFSIKRQDIPAFERYIVQLKTYYFDYRSELPESSYMHEILGLNLLRLLAQNRIADFHLELELLDSLELHKNVYLKQPLALEQYLMEGSYNKVFLSRGNVPAESYLFFINILMTTIRIEIAACIERAYSRLPVTDARSMLFFDSKQQLLDFAVEQSWKCSENDVITFPGSDTSDTTNTPVDIPYEQLIKYSLHYARELEKIV